MYKSVNACEDKTEGKADLKNAPNEEYSSGMYVKNISENISLVKEITGNKPVPLLIYLCDAPIPSKETRKFSTEQLKQELFTIQIPILVKA